MLTILSQVGNITQEILLTLGCTKETEFRGYTKRVARPK